MRGQDDAGVKQLPLKQLITDKDSRWSDTPQFTAHSEPTTLERENSPTRPLDDDTNEAAATAQAEEETKQMQVPRNARYFLHDNREDGEEPSDADQAGVPIASDKSYGKGRGKGRDRAVPEDGPWVHDKYFELIQGKQSKTWKQKTAAPEANKNGAQHSGRPQKSWKPKSVENDANWSNKWGHKDWNASSGRDNHWQESSLKEESEWNQNWSNRESNQRRGPGRGWGASGRGGGGSWGGDDSWVADDAVGQDLAQKPVPTKRYSQMTF